MAYPDFPPGVDRPWLHPLIVWLRGVMGAGNSVADPGSVTAAIPVDKSGVVPLATAGAETRTLADPEFVGQQLALVGSSITTSCTITAAHRVNSANNTTIELTATGQAVVLEGISIGGALRWMIIQNDGATLS